MARTILIGDVHGCAAELSELIERLAPTSADRVVFVGDLVARGPDSRGVLRIVRELGALSVRGNHEEKLLAARQARSAGAAKPKKLGASHAALVAELDEVEWAQLEALPLRLELEPGQLWVVHAGVVPGVAWEEQDPWLLTHIRSIAEDGTPSARWGRPWGESYRGPHIVFGHNAQRAPQLHVDATGIDTACVYGGELTALVLVDGAPIPPPESRRDALVSVPAKEAYMDYGRPLPGS